MCIFAVLVLLYYSVDLTAATLSLPSDDQADVMVLRASPLMSAGFLVGWRAPSLHQGRSDYGFLHLTYAPASNPCSSMFLPLLKATALCYSSLGCCTTL